MKEETAQLLRKELCMELSWEKTRIAHTSQGLDFLGNHIVLKPNHRGQVAIRIYPSKKSLRSVQEKVKKITSKNMTGSSLADTLGQLNSVLRGWSNYFRFAHSKKTFSYLRYYSWMRVYWWMRKKHRKLPVKALKRKYFPDWTFKEGGLALFDPSKVRVGRYGYRGAHIPTLWNQELESPTRKRQGDRLPDEPRLLEYLEDRCAM
ncbi:MAG: hypothetical protein HY547_03190 [Elusimicrobia bacterium]|nr:hypothetical protein [Elusimicrobiota bacterium]